MEINSKHKDIIGKVFFTLSFIIFIYMLVTPNNQLILHVDEYFTLTLINFNVNDIISITAADVHPPLYYLILKFAMNVFGFFGISSHNLFAVKLVSIIPFPLIMIISYVKIRKDYGWLAAGLFIFSLGVMSEFFIYFLIARMYSWAILFLLIAFIYTKDIFEKGDIKYWAIVTVASVLCAYTHYFAAISALSLYLFIIYYVVTKNRAQIKHLCVSIVAAVLLYSFWIFTLINQLNAVHKAFWVPRLRIQTLIEAVGYFAYMRDLYIAAAAIIIVFAILLLYKRQLKEKYTLDNFYLLTGIGVYLGTIVLAVIVSLAFKPILLARYLMPAAVVLWLTLSILISKIEDKKTMIYSFVLIGILLIAGTGHMISTNFLVYNEGIAKENAFDQIINDENSSLILARPNGVMYFLDYSDRVDTYCIGYTQVFGEKMKDMHNVFDFKETSEKQMSDLVLNNTDRNFYLINIKTWGSLNLAPEISRIEMISDQGIVIAKLVVNESAVNKTNVT